MKGYRFDQRPCFKNSFGRRSNITAERFLGHYRFIPDSELPIKIFEIFEKIFQYCVEYISKLFCAARFTKIGVPEGRVEGKSRLCNFAIHGNKFRGR